MKIFKQITIIIITYQQFCITKGQLKGPCENFYEYICHNSTNNFSEITLQLDYEFNKKLLKYLSESSAYISYDKQNYSDKMRIYLESCKGETKRNLRKYFDQIRPNSKLNWPLLEQKETWLETNKTFDFWSLLGQIHSHGFNNLIIEHDLIRNKNNTINIWLAPATISKQGSLPDNNIIMVLLRLLDIQQDTEPIVQQLRATDFKWQGIVDNYSNSNLAIELTYQELVLFYPKLNLQLFLEQLLVKQELENISNIIIENPKYFEYLNDKIWTEEELLQLTNYLMIKFLYYLAQDSTDAFAAAECLKDLRNKFDLAINFYYYNIVSKSQALQYRSPLNRLVRQLKETMAKYFDHNHLNLSGKQIIYLKSKLEAIKINIGNLPENVDYNKIKGFYQDLPNLHRDNYYKNHLLLLKHRFSKTLLYIQNQTHFIETGNRLGSLSSPFYIPQQNMIIIPLGSFQKSFFHFEQTPLQQLSLFGFVLAHELAHAFDTFGLLYDQQGFLLAQPLAIRENENFSKSLKCLQQQQHTDSIDERIADLFAMHITYNTYFENYANKSKIRSQEFFNSFAQFFCSKDNIKFIQHDSDSIRLQQIVKNFSPFSWTFECPEESPMNPKTKCQLY